MIRHAKASEIEKIITITRACAGAMISEGIYQWNDEYPNAMAFEKDIERGELYTLSEAGVIIGCIVISVAQDPEYQDISWLTPNENNHYIHRLAIHPKFQGVGYARTLMDFAEGIAHEKKAISIRLDTFSKNKRNQKFYETRGYTRLGDVFFPNQSTHPFHCYELVL